MSLTNCRRLYGSVTSIAKKMVSLELEKVSPVIYRFWLFGTRSFFQKKQFTMTEYYLEKLQKTKDNRIKASAFTIRGMMNEMDGNLPEAIEEWNKALKLYPKYIPAKLNIGFYALKYGDFNTAKKYLSGMNDYFSLTGYMQASRQSSPSDTKRLCSRILSKKSNYKPAMLSCALNIAQGEGDLKKAIDSLRK